MKKILIVDDEEYVLQMIELHLQNEGFQVLTCSSEEDALRVSSQAKPDLILMDLMLGKQDGIEVVKKLKEMRETESIPILVLTGKSLEKDRDDALSAGADGFITKPILPNRLVQQIRTFFSG